MGETDYRKAYEEERLRCEELTGRIGDMAGRMAELEAKNEELERKLNRIRGNILWKLMRPALSVLRWGKRQWVRLRNCGSLKGVVQKLNYKRRERAAMRQFGTASFPTPEEAAAQRETVFPRMVKISILVPLWNNERQFQVELLECVMNQTYPNWELCLADGSDEAHSYRGEICR